MPLPGTHFTASTFDEYLAERARERRAFESGVPGVAAPPAVARRREGAPSRRTARAAARPARAALAPKPVGDVPEPLTATLAEVAAQAMANAAIAPAPNPPRTSRTVRPAADPVRAGNGRAGSATPARRRGGRDSPLAAAFASPPRRTVRRPQSERRVRERRVRPEPLPFPDRRLTRSAYEQVFLKLVSGGRLKVGSESYKPVGMRGWDQAVFRRESDGRQRLFTIDQLLRRMKDWA
jgi:hypothetical protein